jgi:ABC-type spermidine/putrescine transport system permease subunit I
MRDDRAEPIPPNVRACHVAEETLGSPGILLTIGRIVRHRAWLILPIAFLYAGLAVLPLGVLLRSSFAEGGAKYQAVLSNPLLLRVVENTVVISGLTAVLSVIAGYILAAALWHANPRARTILLALILLPFWTGVLVKNFAWTALLQDAGPINQFLQFSGLASGPMPLLHNRFAVILGMVHYALPYTIFPIFATMLAIDDRLSRAACSLGASGLKVFWFITLPLTLPGVYAGGLLVFIIASGFFITPVILGGPADMMVANLMDYYVHEIVDFNGGSALAALVVVVVSLLIVIYQRLPKEGQHGGV